jgi:ketosteroid isomerase-like protein
MSGAIVSDPFTDAQDAVGARMEEILDACRVKDFARLSAYHLSGPKFSKYDDEGPQGRQDDRTAMQAEIDAFTPLEGFDGRFDDLKIDVFGAVAVATGIFRCTFTIGGESGAAQSRSTIVLVNDDGNWLIAHEHHSPFVEEG